MRERNKIDDCCRVFGNSDHNRNQVKVECNCGCKKQIADLEKKVEAGRAALNRTLTQIEIYTHNPAWVKTLRKAIVEALERLKREG